MLVITKNVGRKNRNWMITINSFVHKFNIHLLFQISLTGGLWLYAVWLFLVSFHFFLGMLELSI